MAARELKAVTYEALWPHVLGVRPIRVVVVRDPSGRMRDAYLFTTDIQATMGGLSRSLPGAGVLKSCSAPASR